MALQGLRIFQVRSESGFLTDDEILERSRAIASLRQQLEIEAVAAAAAAASDSSNSCLKSATGGGFGVRLKGHRTMPDIFLPDTDIFRIRT